MNGELHTSGEALLLASFALGDAVFGIDAQQIQEVAKVGEITPVRHAPSCVIGIRNLRGRVITVLDLRIRLELGSVQVGSDSRVLIVEGEGEPVGLLVDRVDDMIAVNLKDLMAAPPNVNGVKNRNLRGVFRGSKRLIAVLDLSTVLHPDLGQGVTQEKLSA